MTKFCSIALCFLCLTIVGTINFIPAIAQDSGDPTAQGSPGSSEESAVKEVPGASEEFAVKEATGEIISVDAAAKTIVAKIVKDEAGGVYDQITLLVNSDTVITSQDSALDISDLKPADKVMVVYKTTADGVNAASSIKVK